MNVKQLKRNLEEPLEKIDLLIEERDNLKESYEDVKENISKMKDKIDHLKSRKESKEKISDNDEVETLKKLNEILKHELKIVEVES